MSVLFERLKNADNQLDEYAKVMSVLERKKRFLGAAYLQLTPLCNFSCKMCYAKMTPYEILKSESRILRYEDWKWYIDCFAEIGTPKLNLTGGECLLHPDFERIYNYAYDLGFEIILMTNGSMISDRLFNLFNDKPPNSFSITVYGGSPDTYHRLCGDGTSYDRVMSNIDRIINKKFNVLIKYTVTSENVDDLPEVYEYFRQRGLILRYQDSLMQFNKADAQTIAKMTVEENKMKTAERRIRGERQQEEDEVDRVSARAMKEQKKLPAKGIRCAAGRSICHIRWDGMMTPCVSFDSVIVDPKKIGMQEAWKRLNEWADNYPVLDECQRCVHVIRCPQCASLHYNDTGSPGMCSPRLCWKKKHPEEAEEIKNRMIKKGLVTAEELYENRI